MRHPVPLLAAVALAACGQPFLSARVEIPEIRIIQPPRDFPAASFDPAFVCSIIGTQACSGQTLDPIDLDGALDQQGVSTELRLTALALHVGGGDARGIKRVELDLVDPATGGLTRIASYVRPDGGASPTDVVTQTSNADLAPFLKDGTLQPRIEVEMDPVYLPTGFSASVETAFSAKVTVNYREAL